METKKYLPLYYEWIKAGKMLPVDWSMCSNTSGLCDAFYRDEVFQLMIPTDEDKLQLAKEGLNLSCWASGSPDYLYHKFTPLRQNIVLLMAAINGEL